MVFGETLKHHFQILGVDVDDPIFLGKCLDLCDLYNLSGELLVEMWVAFMVDKNSPLEPMLDTLDQLERMLLKKDKKTSAVNHSESSITIAEDSKPNITYAENDGILEMYGYKGPSTPNIKRSRSPEGADPPIARQCKIRALDTAFSPASYTKRADTPRRVLDDQTRGKILEKFGASGDAIDWKAPVRWEPAVSGTNDPSVPADAMYMFELLSKKARNAQRVCREYGARLCSAWCRMSAGPEAPPLTANVRNQSQTNFRTWGRIICETDGKLNAAAIMLEGCKAPPQPGVSATVSLDLTSIPSYSIFPGQILAVEGKNPTGNELIASALYSSGYTRPSPAPKIKDDLRIFVASGPFTGLTENLDYQPLFRLMERVAEIEPNVLILLGPFLPVNHPDIRDATILDTFQELFQQLVEKIMTFVKGKCTRVVLIPSSRDAHHDPVYPTPAFFLPKSMHRSNLHLMPDPCMLDIEGLTIGATSVDIMRHLGGEEVNLNMTGMDRLGRLANHILSQGCFYPLHPPSKEVNVDTELWEKYAFMYQQPHVLLLPSDMRYFCKWTHDCLVVNPERVNKHTYARIVVRPSTDGAWSERQVDCEILKV